MKKLLTAAFIVMLMGCICIGGALFVQAQEDGSQDPVQHTHNWTYDYDTNTATCNAEGCTVTDATCSDHTADTTKWLHVTDENGTYHYRVCEICEIELAESKAKCEGGTATCKKGPICTECQTEYGAPVADAHTWENSECTVEGCDATCNHEGKLSTSNLSVGQHKTDCSVCDYEKIEDCTGGTATCIALATCTECGDAYGEYAAHDKTGGLLQNTELYYHYYFCSVCEQEVEVQACYGGVATCTQLAICKGCGNTYGELMHNKDTELKQNVEEGYHYYTCVDCGEELDVEECHGGTAADCTHLPECVVCGNPYGEEYGAHTMAPIASRHEENPGQYHVLTYPCCDQVVEAEHTVGTAANCHSANVCAVCNMQYGQIDPNNHDVSNATYVPLNATQHKVVCKCGTELEPATHRGGAATCSKQAICVDCGAAYGSYNGVHSYDNDCDADCNDCGATRTPAEHVFGEWEVTKKPTETEAGEQKRVCTVCGETQMATIAAITNLNASGEPEPDAIKASTVVIIVAAVVVAAVGVVAIVLLTKKKKK